MRSILSTLTLSLLLLPTASAQSLSPRQPIPKGAVRAVPFPPEVAFPLQHRLTVKFVDGVLARPTEDGGLVSRAGADLSSALQVAQGHDALFEPLILVPESDLAALEARAAQRSGRAQPDLAGTMVVALPTAGPAALEAAGSALLALPEVEYAYVETLGVPPPGDIAPTTPVLIGNQGYRAANPGLDVGYAWGEGYRGQGIRISDCEYGWNPAHEDLVDRSLNPEPGQTMHPQVLANGWDSHGTAVVGETSAVANAYGCNGIAEGADLFTYTEWSVQQGLRRVTCVTNAINASSAGDVVLLEMQTTGAGGGFGPAELNPSIWNVTRLGSDAGVIVVAAAGNGNQNLDSASYASYQAMGDSGAIVVGAGTADTFHHKLSFSTYGTRVNVQGWGTAVFSLGYGGFAEYGGDKNQRYTSTFGGTSSASPFIAASCAILQQAALDRSGVLLSPADMRQLLIDTGRPQGTGGHIGPFPDLRAAIEGLPTAEPVTYCIGKANSDLCVPFITTVGFASTTDTNSFLIRGNDIIDNQAGLLVYGINGRGNIPFHNAKLCVKAPLIRLLPPKSSGGGVGFCPGMLKVNFNNRIQSGSDPLLTSGQQINAQFIYRDPGIDPFGDGLTDGVEFVIDP